MFDEIVNEEYEFMLDFLRWLNEDAHRYFKNIMYGRGSFINRMRNESVEKGFVNTFPADQTGPICPTWIGVIGEAGKRNYHKRATTKDEVLEDGINWAVKARDSFYREELNAIILIDKWNKSLEKEIIRTFRSEYIRGNFSVSVFIYNEYGMSPLPFVMSRANRPLD